ncbi:hypothetical protein [Psychrobacillus sp. FSL K6-1464]|uniref:hypothetical protein n=1 Tax=Psychrobacillus sp. FSL K6-1464 TaxID=2921545 RepID=UPI0030FB5307
MTLSQFALKLLDLGYPVAYSHFVNTEENPAPSPPFICYLVVDSDTFSADNKPIHESTLVDIELYSTTKNLVAEGKVKSMLTENELSWYYDEQFIETEGVFKCTFSITLI